MRANTKTPENESADSFAFFKQAVNDIFSVVIEDFHLSSVAIVEHMPDCVIKYQNETTGLKVRYEWKSQVSVDLVKLERTPFEVKEERSYEALVLMELRRPEIDVHKFYGGDQEWTSDYIEKLLRQYAMFLKDDARDVLTGDFSVFPELRKLSAKYRREKNKEYFGTYSGGSPRFKTRPSLEQVFAGATDVDPELERLFGGKLNQDQTQSRIYEAYWDYQYSILEIAKFLNQTEKHIERELDDHDDHC